MIEVQPTADYPMPFDLEDEQPKTSADSIAIAVNTVDLISDLGGFGGDETGAGAGSLDYTPEDFQKAVGLIQNTKTTTPKTISQTGTARVLAVAVKEYDFQVFADVQQARNFVTSKLVKIADCGDPKLELKALELLGKHSDIGLFTDRSEITVHHTTSQGLENSIKERIKRLLNSDVIDITPLDDLDTHLGAKAEIVEAKDTGEKNRNDMKEAE